MSEHTPGPWVFGDGGWDGQFPYLNIYYEDNAPIIASVLSEEVGIDAAKKNAALIVAAPEMFDAIEAALRIDSLWVPHFSKVTSESDMAELRALAKMHDRFRAAISKVVGQASDEILKEAPSSEG